MILENIDYSKCIILGVNTVDSEFNTDKLRLVSDVFILNLVTGNIEIKNYSDCVKNGWYLFADSGTRTRAMYKSDLKTYNIIDGKLYDCSYGSIDIVYVDGDNYGIENYLVSSYSSSYRVWHNLESGYTNLLFNGFDLTSGQRLTTNDIKNHLLVTSDYVDDLINSLSLNLDGFKAFGNTLMFSGVCSDTVIVPNGYKYVIFDTIISDNISDLVIPPTVELVIDVGRLLELEKIYLPKGTKLGDIFYSYPKGFPKKVEIIEY
jgi:hypothetical protein